MIKCLLGKIGMENAPLTDNVNVASMSSLRTPLELKAILPLLEEQRQLVLTTRQEVNAILAGESKRFMLITGPCSIHDEKAA